MKLSIVFKSNESGFLILHKVHHICLPVFTEDRIKVLTIGDSMWSEVFINRLNTFLMIRYYNFEKNIYGKS